ncbi:MAG TPA: hypothetical protein VFW07_12890 [Parafilimonas sp.]|nr:hypothetical protein [Parafilimonas sp.]
MRRRLILFALFIIFYTMTHAQYAGWMLGLWKNTGGTGSVTQTIQINDVTRESFTGTKTSEMNDGSHAKITISISGIFRGTGLYLHDGEALHKEGPENAQWYDCYACPQDNKMIIHKDSLILVNSISDCDEKCNGETFFYRLLSEYDSATQRHLVDRFGKPPDIIAFRPFQPQENETIASNDDKTPEKDVVDDSTRIAQQRKQQQQITDSANLAKQKKQQHIKDSLDNVARIRQQQIRDSTLLAQQKKREQQIADSLNLVKQKEQQRIKDSLDNVARLEQKRLRTEDSLRDVQVKKRQQEIVDSINLVKQKEQQRIKDSLDNVARLEQKRLRTEDSLRNVQAKKRQQEITDSINLVKQKEQKRIKDSLDNVARIRQQQIDDSTLLAQHKKREKEIADSLNLVKQKEQQRIQDSLDNVARLEQKRLRTEDSLRDVQAKKRQQEITDSINLVRQKEQQRIKDSLNNVARLEQIRRQTEDSLRNVQIKKRQQEIADSLNLVNQREQQRIKDSLQNVAAVNLQKQRTADSLRDVQARKRQQEIADSLAAVRKQRYDDSLQKAALAKAVPPPTTGSAPFAADKALTSRASVLLETYHITSPDILIELFDNGEIDSDRVSVYHNNAIIVSNQVLGIKPITVKVHADAANREHEFVMIAENLGSIPPNSALMRVTAGKQSYKLSVNTDMKTNAKIVFYYDGN